MWPLVPLRHTQEQPLLGTELLSPQGLLTLGALSGTE